ncbi:hypothetical protein SAMN02910298_02926 [Pseudobutyrivibrio sp. YE44]|uniref:hypothetical protein n=1 Tax=Pseudobutyrivibrio sp. YE44 TaxID=1520802 RepID=UPI00088B67C1|nr:hypothetical protein [Pseudobutyrivibrio sp. YE44]SDB56777.1 hypothetical protein SAMN02910298_02926 [Pseudobutyrivibrio sp. YE44]
MKNKGLILVLLILVIIITAMVSVLFVVNREDRQSEPIEKNFDEFFYVATEDSDAILYDKKLKSAAVYYNLITGKSISKSDLKSAYKNKNELYKDYIKNYNEYSIEAVRDSLDLIARREFDCFFYSALTEEQQSTVDDILYSIQKLADSYYGEDKVYAFDLSYDQQLELYNLYLDSSYMLDEIRMKKSEDKNRMLVDCPTYYPEYVNLSEDVILRHFEGRKRDDKITFNEDDLEIDAFYYNLISESDVTVEDLENAYYERNELCYNFLCYEQNCCSEIENTLWNISFKEGQAVSFAEGKDTFPKLDKKGKREIEKIYLREQEIVADYYRDRRVMLYALSEAQKDEVYKAYVDPDYQMDSSVMGDRDLYSRNPKYVKHGVITYINGNNIVVENQHNEGIKEYEGKYYDLSGLKEGDYVEMVFDDKLDSIGFASHKYDGIQFIKIEVQEK